MATTTTLGFSILSRYSGHGVTQARRDLAALRAQMAVINGDLQRHTQILNGIPQRWKAIGAAALSIAPALIPLSAAALQIAGTFTAMSVAVGAALGAYGAAMKGAISKTMEMAKAGKALSPVQKEFVSSVNGMKDAWKQFIAETQNKTLATATNVVQGLTNGIKLLKPLVDAIHPSLLQVSKDFEAWTKGDSARNYSSLLSAIAKTVMPSLMQAGKDVLNVLGDGFRAFAPLTKAMSQSIAEGAAALKSWSDGGGFQRFLQYVRDNAPAVQAFWASFRDALQNVFNILRQFSGGVLSVLTDALKAIAAINPETFKAFASALLLIKAPLLWLVLNCPPLRDAMIALIGAMNPQIIYAVAGAFVALRIAFMLMNTALLTTPLGWVILGLVALGVAITVIATKTTWFQTAWTYTWNFIKAVAHAVWTGLQVAWHAFISAMQTAWSAVSGALVAAWNAVWNAISMVVRAIWTGLTTAWNAVCMAFSTAWSAISAVFSASWTAVWNAIKAAAEFVWTALQVAWSTFITGLQIIWTTVSGALSAAWTAVWNAIKMAAEFVWTALQAAWNAFITGLQVIWSTVSGALSATWSAVWNALKTAAEFVWNALRTAWDALFQAIRNTFNTVMGALSASWSTVWNAIKAVAEAVWNALKAAWNAFFQAMRTTFNTVMGALQSSWQLIWNTIKTVAQTIWNAIKTAWDAFFLAMRTIFNTVMGAIRNSWELIWNTIKNVAQTIWNWIKDRWNEFIEGIKLIWNTASEWLKDKWNAVWNSLKETANKVWHEIGEIIEKAINAVTGIINKLIGGFNKITSFLKIDVKISDIPKVNFNFAEGGMVGLTPYMVGGVAEFAHGGVTNLKRGGTLSGYAPGRDTIPAVLSRGEGVLTPEAVRGMGGPGFVHAANRQFAGHRGAGKQAKAPLSRYTGSHDWTPQSRGGSGVWGKRRGRGRHRNRFADGGMVGVQHFAVGGMTAAALAKAGVSLGMVSQGEYSNGSLSAGTHLGGGVVDIASTSPALVAALRAAGFAAWARGPADGMSPHIHAVLMSHPDLSPAARAQVASFLAGGNGLGAGGGGGGGGFDIMGMLKEHIGKILKNVYKGVSALAGIGGGIADFFGMGGDEDEGNGGLFGTGIGPDVGPDVVKGAGKVIGAVTGMDGLQGMLGRMVLSMLDKGSIAEGLSDAGGELKGFGDLAGGFGKIAVGMGKKILDEVMPDFLLKEKEKAGPLEFAAGGAGVAGWAAMAALALAKAGISPGQLPNFLALMMAESGGNPMAINNWDSNAAMGQASRGLMQVIPSTFAAFRDPSLSSNIFDPMANMVAAARYIKSVYGGVVPGSPYANGTPGATRGVHLVGEQGPELMNFAGGETITPAKETAGIMAAAPTMGAVPSLGSMPEDMTERFQLLMQLAQQMATTVQASWTSVQNAGMTAQSAMAPLFTDMAAQLGTEIPTAMATMSATSAATWTAMSSGTAASWAEMRDGTFAEAGDRMSVKMPQWGNEMNTAVTAAWWAMGDATGQAWEGMKEATRGPTNWIIENSYNNGLARLWNEVAAVIFEGGGRTLPSVAALAKGGPVFGAGTATSDSIPAMLSNGEHVWTAEEVRRAGGHKAVAGMRSSIMGGKPVQGATGGPGFALGGWLAGAGSVGGGSIDISVPELKRGFISDAIAPLFETIETMTRTALGGSDYRKGSAIADALSPAQWMRDYIKKDDELNRGGEGAEWARAQVGKPYVLGTFGDTFDCSTYMSGIATTIRDGVAAPWFTTHPFHGGAQSPLPGWERNLDAPFQIGITSSGIGHTGGTVNGENFEATPPAVRSGPAARGADHSMYTYRYGFVPSGAGGAGGAGNSVDPADIAQGVTSFDRGGLLQPGYTMAFNGTGKPEPVGHDLIGRGGHGKIKIDMPITINGNTDAEKVVEGINSQVLPKLRQALSQGIGTNG